MLRWVHDWPIIFEWFICLRLKQLSHINNLQLIVSTYHEGLYNTRGYSCLARGTHLELELSKMVVQGSHVLIVPYPGQGHLNPMLQFGKHLAHHGLTVTVATTRYILSTNPPDPKLTHINFAPISDGFDDGGFGACGDIPSYLARMELVGSQSLTDLIESSSAEGRPVRVMVYEPFLPWALDVGKRLGITCAAFFTQSCAVDAIYSHVRDGKLSLPAEEAVELPGLPRLEPADLPSYFTDPVPGPYQAYFEMLVQQFSNLERADIVLINSFYELESRELDWLKTSWPVTTVGPTVPSKYLDNEIPSDGHYGFNLFTPDTGPCMSWLDSQTPKSVVYVSYGSMSDINSKQTEEIARALQNSGKNFLWVVRKTEMSKVPIDFINETANQGLVVSWSPQLEVLAHPSVGCFVTHCGWNSTTEGLSLGVPMIGVPQWTDQQTNAKYVEDVWKVGVRVKVDEKRFLKRDELERCIREVMEGDRSEEIRTNAGKWREMAKTAASKGGSSNKNILEFIEKYCS